MAPGLEDTTTTPVRSRSMRTAPAETAGASASAPAAASPETYVALGAPASDSPAESAPGQNGAEPDAANGYAAGYAATQASDARATRPGSARGIERMAPTRPGGQPPRGPTPYNPGARGSQRPPMQGYDERSQRPRTPAYEPGMYPPANAGPYAAPNGLGTYDPYRGGPGGSHAGGPPSGSGRMPRGRNYTAYTGYSDVPQAGRGYGEGRGQRNTPGGRRDQATPGSYSEPRRGMTGRRGVPGPHDRRMPADGRGTPRGRPGREPVGAPGDLYTRAPQAPAAPASEGRYAVNYGQRAPAEPARTVDIAGVVWLGGGQGLSPAELLDPRTLQSIARLHPEDARRIGLRSGDLIEARAEERGGRRSVTEVVSVDGAPPDHLGERRVFEQLTATFPTRRIHLEQGPRPLSPRIVDLFAPLGFGSRALIVAPPKTGKTTLIREAAEAVLTGYPDAVVMAVLVGERPEEVTDLRARLEPRGGLVYAASFDEETERHAWLVQVAVERAKRVAESGRDAFMVLDSLTRLARAENLASRGQGRTLSGGIDAQALDTGRRAFGAARNLDEGGSLTILATCLVDTGSRQDDVVYEEFKGTGNMELHLSRDLAQRRLYPAVDAMKSSTRREETLLTPDELRVSTALRRRLADLPPQQATQQLLTVMERTTSNAALLRALDESGTLTR